MYRYVLKRLLMLIPVLLCVAFVIYAIMDVAEGDPVYSVVSADASPEEIKAYMDFVTALCRMAKEAKRITAKDKPTENEKYTFRCFLLRLGFIGDEFKQSRKILLQNFTGSSAWKNGSPDKEVQA